MIMFEISETNINEFKENFQNYIGNSDITIENILKWFHSMKNSSIDFSIFSKFFNLFFIGDKSSYQDDIRNCFEYFDKNKDGLLDSEEFNEVCSVLIEPFLKPRAALIIVDVQNDFIDGLLPINNCPAKEEGAEVVPVINSILNKCLDHELEFASVVYTYDWHPENHISFFENIHLYKFSPNSPINKKDAKPCDTVIMLTDSGEEVEQIIWPKHCIENTEGSALHRDLLVVDGAYHVRKGYFTTTDSYSAFGLYHPNAVTDLNNHLREHSINLLFVCGIATDVCVANTIYDALKLGYKTVLVKDASRGVNLTNIEAAQKRMNENLAIITTSSMISSIISGNVRPIQLAVAQLRHIINTQN